MDPASFAAGVAVYPPRGVLNLFLINASVSTGGAFSYTTVPLPDPSAGYGGGGGPPMNVWGSFTVNDTDAATRSPSGKYFFGFGIKPWTTPGSPTDTSASAGFRVVVGLTPRDDFTLPAGAMLTVPATRFFAQYGAVPTPTPTGPVASSPDRPWRPVTSSTGNLRLALEGCAITGAWRCGSFWGGGGEGGSTPVPKPSTSPLPSTTTTPQSLTATPSRASLSASPVPPSQGPVYSYYATQSPWPVASYGASPPPQPSPTPVVCPLVPAAYVGVGATGETPVIAAAASPLLSSPWNDTFSPNDCRYSLPYGVDITRTAGAKHVVALDLGADFVPGGRLLLDTCGPETTMDTIVYAGQLEGCGTFTGYNGGGSGGGMPPVRRLQSAGDGVYTFNNTGYFNCRGE